MSAIDPLPTFPNRFVDSPEAFDEKAQNWTAALPGWTAQANALRLEVVNAVNAAFAAGLASAASNAANALANANIATAARLVVEALELAARNHADAAAASAGIAASYTENTGIRMTARVIAESVAIGDGFNGVSAGPVTVGSGATVTVLPGSHWSIV